MNIALIQCPAWITDTPPLSLSILAASLKDKAFKVTCYDLNIDLFQQLHQNPDSEIPISSWDFSHIDTFWNTEEKALTAYQLARKSIDNILENFRQNPQLAACFTVHYTSFHFTRLLTQEIKKTFPKMLTIWGGPYCFNAFGKTENIIHNMPEVDVFCTADGDQSLPDLLTFYNKHSRFTETPGYYIRSLQKSFPYYTGDATSDISAIPISAFNCFNTSQYRFEYLPILVTKGCTNRCAFCYECKAYKKYTVRDPKQITNEINFHLKQNYPVNTLWFTGSNIGGKADYLRELCHNLIKDTPNIKWTSQIAVHYSLEKDIFQLMKQSGCSYLNFGIESGSKRILKKMNKQFTPKLARRKLKYIYKIGISFNFNIIVGFPGENVMSYLKTLCFIKGFIKYNIKPSIATCKILAGSRTYKFPEKYSILNPRSEQWYCKQGGNTLATRELQKYYADKLYSSRWINFNFIAGKFMQHSLYLTTQKQKKFNHQWPKYIATIIDIFSYPVFLIWLLAVFFHVSI
jgi:anaerobic magnesium-protoporphyrin IX monomethyl ester cyclase